jgi:hypothetical protein
VNTTTAGSVVTLQNYAGESSTDSPGNSQVILYIVVGKANIGLYEANI